MTTHVAERYVLARAGINKPTQDYWEALQEKGLLKYRLGDIKAPSLHDVRKMIENPSLICFVVVDPFKRFVVGECMLENFQGSTAQIHFSIHPSVRGREAISIAKAGSRQLFQAYPHLTNLTGLTPESNRLVIRFIQKVGYKICCTLDNAANTCYKENSVDNAVITQLSRDSI